MHIRAYMVINKADVVMEFTQSHYRVSNILLPYVTRGTVGERRLFYTGMDN